LGLQARFDEAIAVLDEVDAEPRDPITATRSSIERGRVLNSSGDSEASKPYFRVAYELACDNHLDFHAVDAAHMLGIVESPEEAAAWNDKALVLAAASTDPRAQKWEASLLNNIGWALHEAGEYELALTRFQRAIELRVAAGKAENIVFAKYAVGRTYRSLGRLEDALAVQLALTEGSPDGWVYAETALCLAELDRAGEAALWAEKALPLLEAEGWVAEEKPELLESLRALAR
jgi:tetratricopeptide (TPR) repeat protein